MSGSIVVKVDYGRAVREVIRDVCHEVLHSAVELKEFIVDSAKELKKEREARLKARAQEQHRAFEQIKKTAVESNSNLKSNLKKLAATIDFTKLSVSPALFDSFSDSDKFNVLTALSNYEYYLERVSDITFTLNDEQIDVIAIDKKIIQLNGQLKRACQKQSIREIIALSDDIQKLLSEVRSLVGSATTAVSHKKYEKINDLLFELENGVNLPYQLVFDAEISDIILTDLNEDDDHLLLEKLTAIETETFKIADLFYGLDYFSDTEVVQNLIDSVLTILADSKLSIATKYDELNKRHTALLSIYNRFKADNTAVINAKEKYDDLILKIFKFEKHLERELTPYNFSPQTVQTDLVKLEEYYKTLQAETTKQYEIEAKRKALRKALLDLQYEHLGSEDTGVVVADYYHMGDGNLVRVSLNDQNEVTLFVGGAKFNDLPTDKSSIVEGQTKFCSDFTKIAEPLANEGIIITEIKELIDPDERYAIDLELPPNVSEQKRLGVRRAKVGRKHNIFSKVRQAKK